MIIKLIQPRMEKRPMDTSMKARMSPSLALLTIANLIPEEHTVIIENENVQRIDFSQPVDLVGITCTVDVFPRAVRIAARFRKMGVPVVAGGIHITSAPQMCKPYFDCLCIGAAERSWGRIVDDCKKGKLKKIYDDNDDLKGEELVSPDYSRIDKSNYLYSNIISTSRGCPYKCDFCYNSCGAYKKMYCCRPIKDVIADIKTIGSKHVMFIDDNFIGNPAWTERFLTAIKPMKLKWNAAVSANIVNMPKLLDLMRDSGCRSLFIGFESINPASISGVHKKQNSIGMYERLVKEIHKRGIMINASFVFGLDGDDPDVFDRTVKWIVDNKIETVTSHILTPYPGTRLYNDLKEQGRITDRNLSHYNTAHVVFKPANMSEKQLYEGYLSVYRQVYSLKNIIRRMPESPQQKLPYLAFNLLYRKFGSFSEKLCRLFSFSRIGLLGEQISYGRNIHKK